MSTRINEQEGSGTLPDPDHVSTSSGQPANGTAANEHWHPGQSTPCHYVGGRRFTPDTAKLALRETPEEREERIRHTLAVLESLRATTPEEEAEQRETLKMLDEALSKGRPLYERIFPADE